MIPNTPTLAPLRGKDAVTGWLELFSRNDPARAQRYQEAVAVFLGERQQPSSWGGTVGTRSANTQRAYAYALTEFFEFLARWRGRVVPPHEVTRKDAMDYVEWLSNRGSSTLLGSQWNFSVRPEKLRDGDQKELLAVYESVKLLGGSARLGEIVRALPAGVRLAHPPNREQPTHPYDIDFEWITGTLRQLLFLRVLDRSPTIATLRKREPDIGLFDPIGPEIFVYLCPELKPVSQATINLRVQALSSFWRVLQRGENTSGEALLRYNVFEEATATASRGLRRAQRQRGKDRRLTPDLMRRLFFAAHDGSLNGHRNSALLWFLLLTGARVEEAVLVRRGAPQTEGERNQWPGWLDLTTSPPSVMLQRKGNLKTRIVMPGTAIRALEDFWKALGESGEIRHRLLLEEPDAPLFPPLSYWGHNALPSSEYGRLGYRKAMATSTVRMWLKRLGESAGFTPDELRRVHPHAFRHAAAGAMAEGGKNLREVQHLLNHGSITTTETYLPDVDDLDRLTGEAEIISWLRQGADDMDQVVVGGEAKRTVDTVSTPVEDQTPGLVVRGEDVVEATFEPLEHELPSGPPLPPYPTPLPMLEAPRHGIVAVGGPPLSQPWPTESYAELAMGRKPSDIAWSGKPQSKWIATWYDRLPPGYGIGKESLLLWDNPRAPLPWPVLSPGQAYPELSQPSDLLEQLERLYDDWMATTPTSALALAQWLQYLGLQTAGLETRLAGEYAWAPFQSDAETGDQIREHDTKWLVEWFRHNAHTFTASQRAFAEVSLPDPSETSDMFWARVRTEIASIGVPAAAPTIPEYFAERDPVHAIYERSPEEWKAFVRWIGRLTGGSDVREQNREEQLLTEEQGELADRQQARARLEIYFELVDESVEFPGDPSTIKQMEAIAQTLKDTYGITVPQSTAKEGREQRINRVLDKRYPRLATPPPPAGNVLGDSRLFRADLLTIDEASHTLLHVPSIKDEFARDHQGRDSECVMRRVARALWERVRDWEYDGARSERKPPSRSELKKQLFIIQLAIMSYITPCAPELERLLDITSERPTEVAERINDKIRRAVLGKPEGSEIGEIVMDLIEVSDPLAQLEEARAAKRIAGYFAHAQTPEDTEITREAERARKREARARYRANARAVLPHPLRLVAATYWPV